MRLGKTASIIHRLDGNAKEFTVVKTSEVSKTSEVYGPNLIAAASSEGVY
jgi:hypothetical protein